MLALFAERLTWYYQGYPPKSVLKLTISLFLLWLCSVHHHLPVLVWLWLSLSLLYKSLKEKQSVNIQWAYSRFISGIKRLFISGGLLSYVHVFSISVWLESTLYAMKHSFEFKLFELLVFTVWERFFIFLEYHQTFFWSILPKRTRQKNFKYLTKMMDRTL